jgi:hypothetical protein
MLVACSRCGRDHEVEDLEPSYARPDRIDALGPEERAALVAAGKLRISNDFCRLTTQEHDLAFVRVLLPIPVTEREEPCCWGLWVSVHPSIFERVYDLWDDPSQLHEGPWRGALANHLASYPDSLDLPGVFRFVDTNQIPYLRLDDDRRHPLIRDQLEGVSEAQVIEWNLALVHASDQADGTDPRSLH